MVCWHVGMGMGLYGVQPLRLGGAEPARASPASSTATTQNVPDVMQRVHWDPEFARRSGNPTTFDYGRMRETWLIHLCTDWMGDDAWLWKLDCEFRRFNYVGDTQWLRGHGHPQVPRRRRPPRRRPRPAGREPAGRGHHARPRHDPAAEPRARPGAPARPARRRHRPAGRARRHRRRVRRRRGDGDRCRRLRVRRRPRASTLDDARAAPRRSTAPTSATRSTTR